MMDVIAGLCVLESEELALTVAHQLKSDLAHLSGKIRLTFKGSFDKANRTSINSYRGPGMEKGLRILERVKKETGLPVLTDYHEAWQAKELASVVNTLQVPAFLCRQTDMIIAGAEACKQFGGSLNIKKGQFLSAEECRNIVEKATHFLKHEQVMLTERGNSFGYNNLVVDMGNFSIMKTFGVRTIHDATHCVQRPGGLGTATGGKREQVELLARAAIAAGADGVFIECHPTPEKALSDAATALQIERVKPLIEQLVAIKEVIR